MEEKTIVNDILADLKSSLTAYTTMISETNNPQLRQELHQLRNKCEKSQYDLYKIAEQKGYYTPSQPASQEQIQQVKSEVTTVPSMQ